MVVDRDGDAAAAEFADLMEGPGGAVHGLQQLEDARLTATVLRFDSGSGQTIPLDVETTQTISLQHGPQE
jgi:hypothetical protein